MFSLSDIAIVDDLNLTIDDLQIISEDEDDVNQDIEDGICLRCGQPIDEDYAALSNNYYCSYCNHTFPTD